MPAPVLGPVGRRRSSTTTTGRQTNCQPKANGPHWRPLGGALRRRADAARPCRRPPPPSQVSHLFRLAPAPKAARELRHEWPEIVTCQQQKSAPIVRGPGQIRCLGGAWRARPPSSARPLAPSHARAHAAKAEQARPARRATSALTLAGLFSAAGRVKASAARSLARGAGVRRRAIGAARRRQARERPGGWPISVHVISRVSRTRVARARPASPCRRAD